MPGFGNQLSSKKRVGIIGGNKPNATALKKAAHMGKLIAQNNYILVNGGMGGVMQASAKAAKEENGLVIAIVPGQSRDQGNPYSDIVIPTGMGYIRNPLVVLNADILVAIDGSYGTLSEIAYAKIYNKTVFGLDTWDIDGIIPLKTPEDVIEKINQYFSNQ